MALVSTLSLIVLRCVQSVIIVQEILDTIVSKQEFDFKIAHHYLPYNYHLNVLHLEY